MQSRAHPAVLVLVGAVITAGAAGAFEPSQNDEVAPTFWRDVLPVL